MIEIVNKLTINVTSTGNQMGANTHVHDQLITLRDFNRTKRMVNSSKKTTRFLDLKCERIKRFVAG